jgi:hypothetical protein
MSPRQSALLVTLLRRRGLMREEVDAVAGASNGPQVIAELRARGLGSELVCIRLHRTDRWGSSCRPGWYYLTPKGKRIARQLLEGFTT